MLKVKDSTFQTVEAKERAPLVALIGCGAITESYYLPALTKHPSILKNLTLVDRNMERAQGLAKEFNVSNCFTDYNDVIEQVDGAIIAVPTHLHYPIAMDFLSRGIHVLCEKPLAQSADKAAELVNEAQKTGAALLVNYTRRLFASFNKVKELLDNKTFGEPLSIKYSVGEVFAWPTVSGFYFSAQESPKGVLLDRGAHVLDVICWWLGGKPEVLSSQNDSFGGPEAVAQVQLKYNRCIVDVKLSLLGKFPCRYKVECENGIIEGDIYDYTSVEVTPASGRKKRLKLKSKEIYYEDYGYKMFMNFLDIITKEARPLVSGQDVLNSIELIDECYQVASRFKMPWYDELEPINV